MRCESSDIRRSPRGAWPRSRAPRLGRGGRGCESRRPEHRWTMTRPRRRPRLESAWCPGGHGVRVLPRPNSTNTRSVSHSSEAQSCKLSVTGCDSPTDLAILRGEISGKTPSKHRQRCTRLVSGRTRCDPGRRLLLEHLVRWSKQYDGRLSISRTGCKSPAHHLDSSSSRSRGPLLHEYEAGFSPRRTGCESRTGQSLTGS